MGGGDESTNAIFFMKDKLNLFFQPCRLLADYGGEGGGATDVSPLLAQFLSYACNLQQ